MLNVESCNIFLGLLWRRTKVTGQDGVQKSKWRRRKYFFEVHRHDGLQYVFQTGSHHVRRQYVMRPWVSIWRCRAASCSHSGAQPRHLGAERIRRRPWRRPRPRRPQRRPPSPPTSCSRRRRRSDAGSPGIGRDQRSAGYYDSRRRWGRTPAAHVNGIPFEGEARPGTGDDGPAFQPSASWISRTHIQIRRLAKISV